MWIQINLWLKTYQIFLCATFWCHWLRLKISNFQLLIFKVNINLKYCNNRSIFNVFDFPPGFVSDLDKRKKYLWVYMCTQYLHLYRSATRLQIISSIMSAPFQCTMVARDFRWHGLIRFMYRSAEFFSKCLIKCELFL